MNGNSTQVTEVQSHKWFVYADFLQRKQNPKNILQSSKTANETVRGSYLLLKLG